MSEVDDDFIINGGHAGLIPLFIRGEVGKGEPLELWTIENQSGRPQPASGPLLLKDALESPPTHHCHWHILLMVIPVNHMKNLEPQGFLHVVTVENGNISFKESYQTPGSGTQSAISNDGKYIITDVPKPYLSTSGYPEVRERTLQLIELGIDGLPMDSTLYEDKISMLLFHDIKFAPDGNVVLSKELYADSAGLDERHPVSVVDISNGGIDETCEDMHFGGQVKLEFIGLKLNDVN